MVDKSVGIITALIPHIGYEKASQLAKEIAASDETVPELIAKKNLLPQNVINNVLSPKAMTEPGILCG